MLNDISSRCVECEKCINECGFLQKYGSPKQIADAYPLENQEYQKIAYECSLCYLCTSVCPVKLNPAGLFLEMRRDAVRQGKDDFSQHAALLNYEKLGSSRMFTWYGLPKGCDTIFFPGCSFSGTRPGRTLEVFQYMSQYIPSLGIVLDCCTKPSHDLGRQDYFSSMFEEMRSYLQENGIRNVYVSCPNCYRVFKDYGNDISVKTVYEFFAGNGLHVSDKMNQTVAVHDPCALRFENAVHADIRKLVSGTGLLIAEMKHEREKTICCGEGGNAGRIDPAFARSWVKVREKEAGPHQMITYCAGCANHFRPFIQTSHVLDLLFEPGKTLAGRVPVSRSPFTYLNRLKLKRRFRQFLKTDVSRERRFSPDIGKRKSSRVKRFFSFLLPGK